MNDGYHRLPDLSPYYYYRTPEGRRLCFAMEEVLQVKPILTATWLVETIGGCKYRVTTNKPEHIETMSAPDIHEAFRARWSRSG